MLVVAAAGNQADASVAYPARAAGVIAVAATTYNGCEADYSNSGRDVDVFAPGGGADAPNVDNPWDHAALPPRRARALHLPADLHLERPPLRPAGRLRGHVDVARRTCRASPRS